MLNVFNYEKYRLKKCLVFSVTYCCYNNVMLIIIIIFLFLIDNKSKFRWCCEITKKTQINPSAIYLVINDCHKVANITQ